MEGMNLAIFLSIAIPLSLYFLITLAGAFVKNMYNTIRGIDTTFRLYRVLTGAMFSAFLMVGLENWLLTKMGLKEIVVIAFFLGILSFELFEKLINSSKHNKFNSFGNTPLNPQSTSEIKHFDTPFGLCQYLILDESLASNLYFEIHLSALTFNIISFSFHQIKNSCTKNFFSDIMVIIIF